MTWHRFWTAIVVFVLVFGFPGMCLLHILQGQAGYMWLPLLIVALICSTMGLSIMMHCCNIKESTK